MNSRILEKKSIDFRNSLGLGSLDSIHLKSLLNKLNVLTVFKPLNSNFSGMAIKVGQDENSDIKRFILINSKKSIGSQHFTICHELYHLFIQKDFTSMVCTTGLFSRGDGEEYNADLFASFLLLPENAIKSIIPDEELIKNHIRLSTILKIEQYFSCSRKALLIRLKDLSIIDNLHLDIYAKDVKRSAIEHGYTTELYEEGNHNNVVGDYGTIAKSLFDSGDISESHYFSLLLDLGINLDELEHISNA